MSTASTQQANLAATVSLKKEQQQKEAGASVLKKQKKKMDIIRNKRAGRFKGWVQVNDRDMAAMDEIGGLHCSKENKSKPISDFVVDNPHDPLYKQHASCIKCTEVSRAAEMERKSKRQQRRAAQ